MKEYKVELSGDGDFRSEECIGIMDMSDIVCTNPPFSMFREFIRTVIAHGKGFLVLGHISALSCIDIARTIMGGGLWLGITTKGGDRMFEVPREYWTFQKKPTVVDGRYYHTVNGIRWYTNLDHEERHKPLDTGVTYDPDAYPKYDTFDAIEVWSYKRIPMDYDGIMGVPMSFMNYWCPEQYEIIGTSQLPPKKKGYATVINGRKVYERLLIRRKIQ